MPSNAQRRQAAKRKLERQLERRAEQQRRKRRSTVLFSALGAVVAVAVVILLVVMVGGDDETTTDTSADSGSSDVPALPAGRSTPLPEQVSCEYPADGREPSKPVEPPRTEGILTSGEGNTDISVSVETSQGNIGLVLHNDDSPCTVNSFLSLASQGWFDDTVCHRLTTYPELQVLQCGDPTGTGSGGPGYQFANEFPTDQFAADDPSSQMPANYARGTLAMANAGPGTNGSQFFLVYGDSQLPPQYTVFGTIDETGLATVDAVAEQGVADGAQEGAPTAETRLISVRMD